MIACSPEPQRRSICSPGTSMPESRVERGDAADRGRLAVGIALAEDHVVDLAAAGSEVRRTSSPITVAASACGGTSRKHAAEAADGRSAAARR